MTDIFGVCGAYINVIFIENRNPILASGLYAYVIAVIVNKPVAKFLVIRVDGGKGLLKTQIIRRCW